MEPETMSEIKKLVDEWNSKYPIGTIVLTSNGFKAKTKSLARVSSSVPCPFIYLDGTNHIYSIESLTPIEPENKEPTDESSNSVNKYIEELNEKIEELVSKAIKDGVNISIKSKVKLNDEEWKIRIKRKVDKAFSDDLTELNSFNF